MPVPYADLQRLHQDSAFVELFTLDCTPIGGSVYRFTNFPNPSGGSLWFGGNEFIPLPIASDGWDFSSTGTPPKPKLTISNSNKTFLSAVLSLGDIVGATVTRVRTYAKYLDAASFTRRNLLSRTEDFRNAAEGGASWSQFDDTANAITVLTGYADPFGGTAADKLTANTTGQSQRQISQTVGSIPLNSNITNSVFAKAGECAFMKLYVTTQTSPIYYPYVVFNLSTGTVATNLSQSGFTLTSEMLDVGDGWYRCGVSLAGTGTGGATSSAIIIQLSSATGANYNAPSVGAGFFLYGAQMEYGTQMTPYQPILTTTHQPLADSTKFIGPEVYIVEQKTAHNNEVIQWQLTSILDRFGMKLPRRQVLKDKGFPGVARTRVIG